MIYKAHAFLKFLYNIFWAKFTVNFSGGVVWYRLTGITKHSNVSKCAFVIFYERIDGYDGTAFFYKILYD